MAVDQQELKIEQGHFDTAWDARERKRENLKKAPQSASGPRASAAAVKRAAEEAMRQLGDPEEAVAFGRFDLEDGERVYIGKHLISAGNQDPLVINWQASYAAPYFQASYDDPCGVILRRKFETQRNRVVDFEELVSQDLADRVDELTESVRSGIDDTVLRDLEQDRTGEMRDIVQTIHAAQYDLIRSPLDQLLVIQGGPGTGKTAVALHRVSWLLYHHRERLGPEDILVVGPNPTFTRYIRSVLPGLGDADVEHRDLGSLGPQKTTRRLEDSATARLKGDERMAGLLETGLWQRVRFPANVDVLEVGTARLRRAEVEEQIRTQTRRNVTYNAGRTAFRNWLNGVATSRARATVTPAQIDAAAERVWPSLTSQAFVRDLLGSRDRLPAAAGDEFTAGDVNRLMRSPAARLADEQWSEADVALVDEVEALLNGPGREYAHVVVDEAQDLSPMQLRSLRRRSALGSMTLVGDLAQSTQSWSRDSWDDVVEALIQAHPASVEELALGYRVPEQVFSLAVQLLPEAAPGITPPRVIRQGPAEPTLEEVHEDERAEKAAALAQEYAGRGLFVGIICPDSLRDELVAVLKKRDIGWSDASSGNLSKSINVVRPVEAKGLEFDAVVVVEPEAIVAESERGLRLLYVALTRTTRYLAVVHSERVLPLAHQPEGPVERPPAMEDSIAEPPPALIDVAQAEPADDEGHVELVPVDEAGAPLHATKVVPPSSQKPPPAIVAPDITLMIARAAAQSLAETVRASVAESLWPQVISYLHEALNVPGDTPDGP